MQAIFMKLNCTKFTLKLHHSQATPPDHTHSPGVLFPESCCCAPVVAPPPEAWEGNRVPRGVYTRPGRFCSCASWVRFM